VGKAVIVGMDLSAPDIDLRRLRRRVGLVFQLPEAQLFEQFVGDDVAYGPRKLGLSREDVRARVRQAMETVGLPFEEFKDRLTFTLSGGQMRRAALAGVGWRAGAAAGGAGAGRANRRSRSSGAASS
jgi:energy-coupling factor transporter ATP-binding protein EcfA2